MRANCKRIITEGTGCVPVSVLTIGMMDNNCMIVSDGREEGAPAMVVDPAGDAQAIIKALGWLKLEYIVCTHNHNDHLIALPELVKETGAKVVAHVADCDIIESGQPGYFGNWDAVAPVHVDVKVKDGDTIKLGSLEFEVIHTPGHTKGGMCLYLEGFDGKPGILFSGDTLFRGATGRVDFEGGSAKEMRASLRTKLAPLPNDTIVFPGHEGLTTIGIERHRVIEAF